MCRGQNGDKPATLGSHEIDLKLLNDVGLTLEVSTKKQHFNVALGGKIMSPNPTRKPIVE